MPENLLGAVVHGSYIDIVILQQTGPNTFRLENETTLKMQIGARPEAYAVLHKQFEDYVRSRKVSCVCIKKSAARLGSMGQAHLDAAELRGVLQCAAIQAGAEVKLFNKGSVSRKAGKRKVDEYLKDDVHWDTVGLSELTKGRREAAFCVVNEFSD